MSSRNMRSGLVDGEKVPNLSIRTFLWTPDYFAETNRKTDAKGGVYSICGIGCMGCAPTGS
jgi:hypothetical protein